MTTTSIRKMRIAPAARSSASSGIPLWIQGLAFLYGFCIQFNMLVGGNGEGVGATGGFGFRLTDFLAVAAAGLLGLHALAPRRILSLAVFTLGVGAVIGLVSLNSEFWGDPRTQILVVHYVGYSFAGLYMAVILSTVAAVDRFCWGLIVGMLLTIPIFILQDLGYASTLIELGLVPGYRDVLYYVTSDYVRYAGLWTHPNEASHVAALSVAAGAYFGFVHRRLLPLGLTAAGMLAIFYYTQSRGGLFVSGVVLAIPIFLGSRRQINILHLVMGIGAVTIIIALVSQIDVVSYRFALDEQTAENVTGRIDSTLAAVQFVLSNPFGSSEEYFSSVLTAASGLSSPHNGFIYFAAIFGLLPLTVLVAAFVVDLRFWRDEEAFFALLALQVSLSFMFEQMPVSYCYAFVMCLLIGHAYLKTRIGSELMKQPAGTVSQRSLQALRHKAS